MHKHKPSTSPTHSEKQFSGFISVNGKGTGFVKVPTLKEDIVIEREYLNTALHGDIVTISLLPHRSRDTRTRGEVLSVDKRARTRFVGTTHTERGMCFVSLGDRRMYTQFILSDDSRKSVAGGLKVVIDMEEWRDPRAMPVATLVEILGPAGEHETEMRAVVINAGFDYHYPEEVEQEARYIQEKKVEIFNEALKNRKDFRGTTTFTIDPFDAKDFDDAISVKDLGDGTYEMGVHIADVSHYVIQNDAIDKEALTRGTSIYLVDRTIPMLPEVLSNDVCSLNPNEDKLTFSAVFIMTRDGEIKSEWFGETVIQSDKRFTYEEAQRILDTGSGTLIEELTTMQIIARALRAKRYKEGSINFDTDEVQFSLDQQGVPISVRRKTRTETMLHIEDFMLLANRRIAAWVSNNLTRLPDEQKIFVYRVHDSPKEERIDQLMMFLKALGHELKAPEGVIGANGINTLLKSIEGTPEEDLVKTATIRTMAKAIYSLKNIGHFGLAFSYYTHFTSPIRRYPDLMVHRLVKAHLNGNPVPASEYAIYEHNAAYSSEREVAAVEAERESVRMKQVEFLSKQIGATFEGVVSGVTEWGMYVEELSTMAEGMVRLRDMKDDFYMLGEHGYELIGENTGKKYRLGDKVKIKLISTDLGARTIDWQLV